MKLVRAVYLSFLLLPASAYAGNSYFEADIMLLNLEISAPGTSFVTYKSDPTAVGFKIGTFLNRNLAVEGVLGMNLGDDNIGNTTTTIELDKLLGVYAVGLVPASPAFDIFGKVGIVTLSYKDSDGDKVDGNGVSFGFGASINLGNQGAIIAELIVYPDTEYGPNVFAFDVVNESSTINFGYQAKF